MEKPLVSIIIPCYNQGEYLQEAVDSALKSFYENIEIIVVDDGSDDVLTQELLKNFCAEKTKVLCQANKGVSEARNFAIKNAKGTYILPLDADDKIHPNYISKAVESMQNNENLGIVYCKAEFFGKKSGVWALKSYKFPDILVQNRIFNSALFKKEDWEMVGGYKSEMDLGCEDWEFWISLIEKGAQVYKIPEVLFFYRKCEVSRTSRALNVFSFFRIRKNIIKFHSKLYAQNLGKIFFPFILESLTHMTRLFKIRLFKLFNV